MFIKKYEESTHIVYKIFGIKFKLKKELNKKILLINSSQDIIEIKKIKGLDIKFKGANNRIIFNEQIPIFKNSKIYCQNNATIIFNKNSSFNELIIDALGKNNKCYFGNNFTNTRYLLISFGREPNLSCNIGEDCMFATNIIFRLSDFHTIIDNATNKITNYGKNIVVGNHVWLTQNVTILKGVHIADNSIIGTGSVVTKDCNTINSMYAGLPAKIIKTNVSWTRECPNEHLSNPCRSREIESNKPNGL